MAREIIKWTAMLAAIAGAMWLYDWNENRSPWGRDIQAAKIEHLKAKLCN